MASGIVLFHFDEPAGIQPADALGNLHDLTVEAGLAMPAVVNGTFTGRGRAFVAANSTGLATRDESEVGTLLQHDATVQAILSVDNATSAKTYTLYARGTNDGTLADRISLGLVLVVRDDRMVEVRLIHQDNNGTLRQMPPGVFAPPGNGKLFLLTATRTWQGRDSMIVRYFVGETMIAELESLYGAIAGGTTARTTVGVRGNAGAWVDYYEGTLDELLVLDFPLTPGEVRQTWRRMTIHQPGGVETFVGLMPPGAPWYDNPGNQIGKRVKAIGQGVGRVVATIEELQDLFLPGAAPNGAIERHEVLAGAVPGPHDSIETRNARVVKHAQEATDFARASLLKVFEEPFGLTADELELLEFTNTIEDYFLDVGPDLDPMRWRVVGTGAAVVGGNKLRLSTPNATDSRYVAAGLGGETVRMPIDTGSVDVFGSGRRRNTGRWYVQAKIADYTGLADGTGIGVFVASLARGEHVWFGVYKYAVTDFGATTYDLRYRIYSAGGALVEESTIGWAGAGRLGSGPIWIRIVPSDEVGFFNIGAVPIEMLISLEGPNSGFVSLFDDAPTLGSMDWAGFSIISTIAAPAATVADVGWLSVHCPDGTRAANLYVLRDADVHGLTSPARAQATMQQVKPGHLYGAACQSRGLVYDDALRGAYDRGPFGGE